MTEKRPHLLIVVPDQWRGDVLGHLGNQGAVTPNLDHLVRTDAVSFRNAFCQVPVCTPSRCSFMSGWYAHVRGHRTMRYMMRPDEPVLLRTLKNAGYHVWWGGKNDLIQPTVGFTEYCSIKYEGLGETPALQPPAGWRGEPGSDTYYSFYQGRKIPSDGSETPARDWDGDWDRIYAAIEQIHRAPTDQPLCLYLLLNYPHPPYGVEEPWYSMIDRAKVPARVPTPTRWEEKPSYYKTSYDRAGMGGWTDDRWTELRATYYGMCARVDHQLGLVLEALREAGIYDDTAIFFFSDHGDFTGDYGLVQKQQSVFPDCLVRVPLVIKPPAWLGVQPRVSDALVELVDFPATVEDLVGLVPEHTHFGRSLGPLLRGETDEHRDAVFCEGGRLPGEQPAIGLGLYELEKESPYWATAGVKGVEGPQTLKAVMCRTRKYKYVRRLYERDELYDLREDPGETTNRIDDPGLAEVLASLKERLLTFFLETGDVVPFQVDHRPP